MPSNTVLKKKNILHLTQLKAGPHISHLVQTTQSSSCF